MEHHEKILTRKNTSVYKENLRLGRSLRGQIVTQTTYALSIF